MPTPRNHETVQASVLKYAKEIRWNFVPCEEAEEWWAVFPTRQSWRDAGQNALGPLSHFSPENQQKEIATALTICHPNVKFPKQECFALQDLSRILLHRLRTAKIRVTTNGTTDYDKILY